MEIFSCQQVALVYICELRIASRSWEDSELGRAVEICTYLNNQIRSSCKSFLSAFLISSLSSLSSLLFLSGLLSWSTSPSDFSPHRWFNMNIELVQQSSTWCVMAFKLQMWKNRLLDETVAGGLGKWKRIVHSQAGHVLSQFGVFPSDT